MPSLNIKDYILAGMALALIVMWTMLSIARTEVSEESAVIAMQKLQIGSFVVAVDKQSAAIEELRVNTTEGIKEVAEKAKVVETRYSTVKVKDNTCEAKLQAYEDLLKIFGERAK